MGGNNAGIKVGKASEDTDLFEEALGRKPGHKETDFVDATGLVGEATEELPEEVKEVEAKPAKKQAKKPAKKPAKKSRAKAKPKAEPFEEEDEGEEESEEEPEEGGEKPEEDGAEEEGKEEPEDEDGEEKPEGKEEGEEDGDEPAVEPYEKNNVTAEEKESDGKEEESEEEGEEGEEDEEEDEDGDEGFEEEKEPEPKPKKADIKRTVVEKAKMAASREKESKIASVIDGIPLVFLSGEGGEDVFIGRKKSVYKMYGDEASLFIGRVDEEEQKGKLVNLDSLNPHVVFVCGARGSGKSYVLGVIAEELARENKNVGAVVIDPVGVFWSMKFPNKEERELRALGEWGLEPEGLDNLKVLIPEGVKNQTPKSTYDATFSMQPSLLTAEDWCLTYGIERFSPTGLLLDLSLRKVEKGYATEEGEKIAPKGKRYSIDDITFALDHDSEINSREKGYKQDSIRALVSRFDAAKNWGIFDAKGTPLSEISKEAQLTVIDTSFLDDNVTALVIGILARRILAARKLNTRKEAAKKFNEKKSVDELLELDIPPTWLFIDEAHTLIPGGNQKTPATTALVEYVKQGRRPGCSLVFATQQPSAIDSRVLSQLDVMISHKLIFDDDIKAIYRRTPTLVPMKYKRSNFIKTLPVGVGLTADRREETSRAFIMRIRPRLSQHEGRDAETNVREDAIPKAELKSMAANMLYGNLETEGSLDMYTVETVVSKLNSKYRGAISVPEVLKDLKRMGVLVEEDRVLLKGIKEKESVEKQLMTDTEKEVAEAGEEGEEGEEGEGEEEEEEGEEGEGEEEEEEEEGEEGLEGDEVELMSLPLRFTEQDAQRLAHAKRKKKIFGLIGGEESIESIQLRHVPIWRVKYEVAAGRNEFLARECFINSLTGEFLHFRGDKFVESVGLKDAFEFTKEEIDLLKIISKKEMPFPKIMSMTRMEEKAVRRVLDKLHFKRVLGKSRHKDGGLFYWLQKDYDLPPGPTHQLLESLKNLPFVKAKILATERPVYDRKSIPALMAKIWDKVMVKEVTELYRPIWFIALVEANRTRKIIVDAVLGKEM